MTNILFGGKAEERAEWAPHLARAIDATGLPLRLEMDPAGIDPAEVDYLLYNPKAPRPDFAAMTRLKAVMSMWAGVESIVGDTAITVPLCRLVDPGLTEGMVDYVVANVARYHMDLDAHILRPPGEWNPVPAPLARHRRVTMLGLGALGAACARALAGLNFDVAGWSRSPRDIPGIACHSGEDGLREALSRAEILVLLLPLTPATENLIDAAALARLPHGAALINPGRGPLIDDEALLAALDAGQLRHATLDVFRTEPLPPDHPYWRHPKVTVTPHIAAETRVETAAEALVAEIARGERGEPYAALVDRTLGY
jgi:glyoxylate/hydroxypyruvate reductase A